MRYELAERITLPSFGDLPHMIAGVFPLIHDLKVLGPVVQTIPVDMVDNLARHHRTIGVGEIPCKVGAVNVPSLVAGGPPLVPKPGHKVPLPPAAPGVAPALKAGMVWSLAALLRSDFGRNITPLVTTRPRTKLRWLLRRMNTSKRLPAHRAVFGGFHTPQHSMEVNN